MIMREIKLALLFAFGTFVCQAFTVPLSSSRTLSQQYSLASSKHGVDNFREFLSRKKRTTKPSLRTSDVPEADVSTRSRWKSISSRILNHLFGSIEEEKGSGSKIMMAGIFGGVRKIHNPVTYLIFATIAGFRWQWCFRNPYYWFAVGFCIKWYRARYVFKIPVWDRQPNWNNIITSKEQEKDLKAFTCKNCGSTIFIAKTREFFFEGTTGLGGLGCFNCGAKGKDNFVMDRDRIVEDVGDMDDYFEYERPLDFVSSAERRKLLKESKGDEEKANQILLDRSLQAMEPTEKNAIDAEIVNEPEPEDEPVTVDAAAGEEEDKLSEDEQVSIKEEKGIEEATMTDSFESETPETEMEEEAASAQDLVGKASILDSSTENVEQGHSAGQMPADSVDNTPSDVITETKMASLPRNMEIENGAPSLSKVTSPSESSAARVQASPSMDGKNDLSVLEMDIY